MLLLNSNEFIALFKIHIYVSWELFCLDTQIPDPQISISTVGTFEFHGQSA